LQSYLVNTNRTLGQC